MAKRVAEVTRKKRRVVVYQFGKADYRVYLFVDGRLLGREVFSGPDSRRRAVSSAKAWL